MTEHYSGHDPATGCAMIALIAVAAVLGFAAGLVVAVLVR